MQTQNLGNVGNRSNSTKMYVCSVYELGKLAGLFEIELIRLAQNNFIVYKQTNFYN